MHITSVEIENIKSIQKLRWEVPAGQEAGWHVIIGDNGSGKTTFLRALALAFIGPYEALQLRQNWSEWIQAENSRGAVNVSFLFDSKIDKKITRGRDHKVSDLFCGFIIERNEKWAFILPEYRSGKKPENYIWSNADGWFSSSFGPMRRFTGGDAEQEKIFFRFPRIARHLSLFGENIALGESIRFLQDLRFKKLENSPNGALLDYVTQLVNQDDFLPHGTRMDKVSSEGVLFIDGNGYRLPVSELSDGFRSILSLTFELIRQLSLTYSPEMIFDKNDPSKVIAPGVVLIDEVDAHLHPTWQRKIGQWFRKYFPNMQFIVTTHSPLICQAAEHGTVFRLPRPGTDETGRMIVGDELNRLVYGNVLDAYGTELFGENVTRSEASEKKLQQLAELNSKELREGLTPKERKKQNELRRMLPTTAYQTNGVKE